MRAVALAAAVCVIAGCGDGQPPCGYVEVLIGYQNIWSGQLAVDDTHVYYADYDIDGAGTQLIWRQPRDGRGAEQPIATSPRGKLFGTGMAVDATHIYWAAMADVGHSLYRTPVGGGAPLTVTPLGMCEPSAVTVSATHAYAATDGCNGGAIVTRVELASGTADPLWIASTNDGDVRSLATIGDVLFIGTTTALFRVDADGTTTVLDAGPIAHVETHGLLYYNNEEGIFSRTATGIRTSLFTFTEDHTGAFSIDDNGDGDLDDELYLVEGSRLLHVAVRGAEPVEVVDDLGYVPSRIIARDGFAYWSVLGLPTYAPGEWGVGAFTGGVLRVSRPCE
jgi:hypothetical protein